jgi:hypothetical protein
MDDPSFIFCLSATMSKPSTNSAASIWEQRINDVWRSDLASDDEVFAMQSKRRLLMNPAMMVKDPTRITKSSCRNPHRRRQVTRGHLANAYVL